MKEKKIYENVLECEIIVDKRPSGTRCFTEKGNSVFIQRYTIIDTNRIYFYFEHVP